MVLNYCDVAAAALGLDGSDCETDHEKVSDYMAGIDVLRRIKSQYFVANGHNEHTLQHYISS